MEKEEMTKAEWLEIGYDKNIIDLEPFEKVIFKDAYAEWFCMKQKYIKGQSLDRIEVTYNRYSSDMAILEKCISEITETDIIKDLTTIIYKYGVPTYKELARIIQVIRSPITFMRDLGRGGAPLLDWEKIKRNIPTKQLTSGISREFAVKIEDVENIMDNVIRWNIYPEKRSACLLLCMNFYMGLRIGELASLTFNDFDFEKNVVKIYKTESKFYNRDINGEKVGTMVYRVVDDLKTVYSVREIPIMPECKYIYEKIKAHHEQCKYDSPYLGYDGSDTILVRSLDRTLRRLCQLCDVEYFNSHKIRKTFATMLHNRNVPIRMISDIMGHSEIGTTENHYILSYRNNYNDMYRNMHDALNYKLSM